MHRHWNGNWLMNKENFSDKLKLLREQLGASQEELADVLAKSHRAFKGVNQVMLSQWERGKTQPSFVRRLGIASFFQQDYDFSIEEMVQVKAATKLMDKPFNFDIAYDYKIGAVETYKLADIPDERLHLIRSMHSKLYGRDFIETAKRLGVPSSDMLVMCFLCENLMIGHVVYETGGNMLFSVGAMSAPIRRQIFDHLAADMPETEFSFPTIDPAMSQFLYDLYFEPCCNKLGLTFYRASIKKVVENPFSQMIQNKHDVYFKYIRYYDLKMKKKSVEFITN